MSTRCVFSPSVLHRTGTASLAPLRDDTAHAISASSVLGSVPSSTASRRSVINVLATDTPPVLTCEPSTAVSSREVSSDSVIVQPSIFVTQLFED